MSKPSVPVYFVGAGPGASDLLTVRALKLLQSADIVLYDALVSDDILAFTRHGAQKFAVGKRAGTPCIAQSEINRMLVRLARPGKTLVRLKGGDPAIFARLAEETGALDAAHIAYEIVPGITTASAAAAAAGLSLTLRGTARRVQFVTAHAKAGAELDLDWDALAKADTTTVFYMVREAAAMISQNLMSRGLLPETPVLLMSDVSRDAERRYSTDVAGIPAAIERFPQGSPLIILVGEATRTALRLARHEERRQSAV